MLNNSQYRLIILSLCLTFNFLPAAEINTKLTPLMEAINDGNLEAVNKELNNPDLKINAQDMHGRTSLFWAAQENHPEVIKQLLQIKDIDVNKADHQGFTPLAIAVSRNNIEAINVLLTDNLVDLETKDNIFGYTPLYRAALIDNLDMFNLLLKAGANANAECIDPKTNRPISILELATKKDNKEIIEEIEQWKKRTLDCLTALSKKDNEGASKIFSNGVDVKYKNNLGQNILLYAIATGNSEIIDKCLKNNWCLHEVTNYNETSLHFAAMHGNLDLVKKLMDKNVDITKSSTNKNIKSPNDNIFLSFISTYIYKVPKDCIDYATCFRHGNVVNYIRTKNVPYSNERELNILFNCAKVTIIILIIQILSENIRDHIF